MTSPTQNNNLFTNFLNLALDKLWPEDRGSPSPVNLITSIWNRCFEKPSTPPPAPLTSSAAVRNLLNRQPTVQLATAPVKFAPDQSLLDMVYSSPWYFNGPEDLAKNFLLDKEAGSFFIVSCQLPHFKIIQNNTTHFSEFTFKIVKDAFFTSETVGMFRLEEVLDSFELDTP
ncbi:MAG: hypothetical protein JSS32_08680 [Verrucomicrobia bacterium]|nr:hypothetical protein [Verrucomicrobiota bacterium]